LLRQAAKPSGGEGGGKPSGWFDWLTTRRKERWLRNSAMESRGKERKMITAKRNMDAL
jgi:hypothetical protein